VYAIRDGAACDVGTPVTGLQTIPIGITPPPTLAHLRVVDPTERALDSDVGSMVEQRAGDVCSLLGIVGAATIAINRRNPQVERIGEVIVTGSMYAGGLDTIIQGRNLLVDGGTGAQERGNTRSSIGSVAYAATGLIPAASIAALGGLHAHPSRREIAGLALLAVNGGMMGYELVHRVPRIVQGEEDLSGYGSLLASAGGFVVAQHVFRR
jgi:hypothetical protein